MTGQLEACRLVHVVCLLRQVHIVSFHCGLRQSSMFSHKGLKMLRIHIYIITVTWSHS